MIKDLTLRDYFAAKALEGQIANDDWFAAVWRSAADAGGEAYLGEALGYNAYDIADSMIKIRGFSAEEMAQARVAHQAKANIDTST